MSAVLVKEAHLGQKGLRTVITGLVKQVLQVLKKPENRTKAKKYKSLVQGVKGMSEIPIGYPSIKELGVELQMQQNFLEPAKLFLRAILLKNSDTF